MTASFDQSAILWQLERGTAAAVLRFHEGAVNAVIALPDGRFATGGEDGRIAFWAGTAAQPAQVLADHRGAVAALALSPDGRTLASASWDATIRLTQLAMARPACSKPSRSGECRGVRAGRADRQQRP